jgi:hypothetical protein
MKRRDLPAILVNAMAQIASEFMLPWPPVNLAIEKFVQEGTAALGVDAKDQNMFGQTFIKTASNLVFDEDYASNPFHMILIIIVLTFLWSLKPKKEVWLYCISLILSCFLFVFIIRWQPFITRIHLPLIILFSPLIGVALEGWKKEATALISVLLFGIAFLTITFSETRPISEVNNPHNLPRSAYYFMKKPTHYLSYDNASKEILSSGCQDVGLLQGGDSWEYPLWALTGYGTVHFRSLNLNSYAVQDHYPCMVVTVDVPRDKAIVLDRATYKLVWQEPPLQIFKQTH